MNVLPLLTAVSIFLSGGDVFTVYDDGTGDFDDITVAVSSVPEGSTLSIRGSFYLQDEGLHINRDLSLIGEEGSVNEIVMVDDPRFYPSVIWASGETDVVLRNLRIYSTPSTIDFGRGIGGVVAYGPVVIDRCYVASAYGEDVGEGCAYTEDFPGVGPSALVALDRTIVTGSVFRGADAPWAQAWTENPNLYDDSPKGYSGGHGIWADWTLMAIVANCDVTGGRGGDVTWNPWPFDGDCANAPCALSVEGGDGGHGIVGGNNEAYDLYVLNSRVTAGSGGSSDWLYCHPCVDLESGTPGRRIDGTAIPITGDDLLVSDLILGQEATISGCGRDPFSPALIFSGTPQKPKEIGRGDWWLASPWFVAIAVPDHSGCFLVSGGVPDDPCLLGLPLVFQSMNVRSVSVPSFVVVGQ